VTRFEKPPTKKKIGMTMSTHVSAHAQDTFPMALVVPMMPSCQYTWPMNQWPNTTTRMLVPRRKSMYLSRVTDVFAASSSIWAAIPPHLRPLRSVAGSGAHPAPPPAPVKAAAGRPVDPDARLSDPCHSVPPAAGARLTSRSLEG